MVLKHKSLHTIALIVLLNISFGYTQDSIKRNIQKGAVYVNAPYAFKQIAENRTNFYAKKGSISGFRIQVFFSSTRNEVQEKKARLSSVHPGLKSYVIYQQPYYKLRVGNFADRREAERFLYKLNKDFPNSFIIPDDIVIQP